MSSKNPTTSHFRSINVMQKTKKRSITKNVGFPKAPVIKVFYEGEDVTPLPLSPLLLDNIKEKPLNTLESIHQDSVSSRTDATSTFKTLSTHKFKSEFKSEMFKTLKSSTMGAKSIDNTDDMLFSLEDKGSSEIAFSCDEPQEEVELAHKPMPEYVNLTLQETDTDIILDIPSTSALKDTPEGTLVEQDNALYEHLTVGKGRNRKVVHQEIQTVPIVLKSRETQKARPQNANESAFASVWDMYDSFMESEDKYKKSKSNDSDSNSESDEKSRGDSDTDDEKSEVVKIFKSQKFQDAVEIIQRLLANNNFNEQQKRFRGLSDPNPFRENIEYNYKLNHLWTFANKEITGRLPVSCMTWSPKNHDVLAVGYGKFYFTDKNDGMVLLWNIKNPVQPERVYAFGVPVTSVAFSILNPNLLAIGFYNGYIKIIDVSARHIRIICQTSKDSFPNFEAVWHLIFEKEKHKPKEFVLSFGQDGRIVKTGPVGAPSMISTQIMRVVKGEGKLKGLETIRKCRNTAVEVCRYPSCLTGTPHPVDDHIYLVGTNEGVVYVCSKHYFHQHLFAFLAHDGPIYAVKYSPYCGKILMTCGDDWHVRIWCQDIDEAILELKVDMQSVQGADWSPIHPTIIATLSGKDIHIWDLQRKTYISQSCQKNPNECLNTTLCFTDDGRCLTVGDIEGNVHIYSLEDMPFAPFFQANLLTNAIHRALVSKPKLKHKILRVGNLHYDMNKIAQANFHTV